MAWAFSVTCVVNVNSINVIHVQKRLGAQKSKWKVTEVVYLEKMAEHL